ncbi:unnamed protein product [Sphagnum troendelagicum]
MDPHQRCVGKSIFLMSGRRRLNCVQKCKHLHLCVTLHQCLCMQLILVIVHLLKEEWDQPICQEDLEGRWNIGGNAFSGHQSPLYLSSFYCLAEHQAMTFGFGHFWQEISSRPIRLGNPNTGLEWKEKMTHHFHPWHVQQPVQFNFLHRTGEV